MIGIIFQFANEYIEVRVDRSNVLFRKSDTPGFATIDGLQLDKQGVIKEFPELKDKENWKEEAIKRFKEKINNMKTEMERVKYIIEDLKKYGYVGQHIQKSGFRPQRII